VRIAIVTDAWFPQVNGVVTALQNTRRELTAMGHQVTMVTPEGSATMGLPTYPEIRLTLRPGREVREALEGFLPEAIHIATEGPLGIAARRYCRRHGLPFTTSFHTRFPEYVRARLPFVPLSWGYLFLRWFHGGATRTLVSTRTLREELHGYGFRDLALWPRGVDTELFRPGQPEPGGPERPRFIYVGRVSVEKGLEAFLDLDLPGSKIVVGDGPALKGLKARYPEVIFTGFRTGEALVRTLAASDVFVFPSRTDTLGLVLYEALACGIPIAAYPTPGPRNVVRPGITGYLDEDLAAAARKALDLDGTRCRQEALAYSWQAATQAFAESLDPIRGAYPGTAGPVAEAPKR